MDILVVDDDRETLDLIRTFLETNGHSVATAASAREAFDHLDQKKPHFILLDVRLPDQDGIEVLKSIKEKRPDLPVVMMTGFKEAEMVVEAFRRGAMDCLLKPFNFEYLKNHILARIHP